MIGRQVGHYEILGNLGQGGMGEVYLAEDISLDGLGPGQETGVGRRPGKQDLSSALTSQGATLGTLAYMSPEQVRGEAVDARSNIFSLGVVFYEMVTGRHPFRRAQAAETTSAILKEDPAPLGRFVDDLPELLRHTVEKMLEKDPAERFQSVHEVLTNLNRLREDTDRAGRETAGRRFDLFLPKLLASWRTVVGLCHGIRRVRRGHLDSGRGNRSRTLAQQQVQREVAGVFSGRSIARLFFG